MNDHRVHKITAIPFWYKVVLFFPHFTFKLITNCFLVLFRYTGSNISSSSRVLVATFCHLSSMGGRDLPISSFSPMGTIKLSSLHVPPSIRILFINKLSSSNF